MIIHVIQNTGFGLEIVTFYYLLNYVVVRLMAGNVLLGQTNFLLEVGSQGRESHPSTCLQN